MAPQKAIFRWPMLTLALSDHLKDWMVTSHLVSSTSLRTLYSLVSMSFIRSTADHWASGIVLATSPGLM